MSEYGKLMSRIWGDKEFTALNDREQKVFMMLFSFPTRNLAGIVPLTIRRWATCSADGTIENITAALMVLIHVRFIIIDWDTEEVLIRTYIRNDEVWKQPNLMNRCLKYCAAVASETLRAAISEELTRIAQELMPTVKNPNTDAQVKMREDTMQTAKDLIKTIPDGFQEPLWKPSEEPSWNPLREPFGEPPGDTPPPAPPPPPAPSTGTNPPAGDSKGVTETSKRGTRLPDAWEPPEDIVRDMHAQFPLVNLRLEHDQFSDYWHAKPGKDGLKLDWVATWRRWIRTAAERQGVTGAPRQSASDRAFVEADALRDNPRLPQNQRLEALLSGDRKELSS